MLYITSTFRSTNSISHYLKLELHSNYYFQALRVSSSSAQYGTAAEIFLTSKFSYFTFFATSPIKLKLQISGRVLIANHLEQSYNWPIRNKGPTVRSYLLHSFMAGENCFGGGDALTLQLRDLHLAVLRKCRVVAS
jgi:hypothetical protein